jgi:hypothetical protein
MRSGESELTIREDPAFQLSFADICGPTVYTGPNGGIDEVVSATVSTGSPECPEFDDIIFRNGFETGGTTLWW